MAEPTWPRHALSIGVFEFRRSVRALWQDKAQLTLRAFGMVIPSLLTLAVTIVFADAIRNLEPFAVPDMVRGTVALFWLFGVYLIAQRVVSARPRINAESLMLTTSQHERSHLDCSSRRCCESLRTLAFQFWY